MRIVRLAALGGIIMFAMATLAIRIEAQVQTFEAQSGANGVVEIELEVEAPGNLDGSVTLSQCDHCGDWVTLKETGVPILANIPYVSRLFKNVSRTSCGCVTDKPAEAAVVASGEVAVYAAPFAQAATQVAQAQPTAYYLQDDIQYYPSQSAPVVSSEPFAATYRWVPDANTWQVQGVELPQPSPSPNYVAPCPTNPHNVAPNSAAALVAANVATFSVAPSTNCQSCPTTRRATAVVPATSCGTQASASQICVERSCSNANCVTATIDLRPCTSNTTAAVPCTSAPCTSTPCASTPCASAPCNSAPCTSVTSVSGPYTAPVCQESACPSTTCPSTTCPSTTVATESCPQAANVEACDGCPACPALTNATGSFTFAVSPQPPCNSAACCSDGASCDDCPACPGASGDLVVGMPIPPRAWTPAIGNRIALGFAAHPHPHPHPSHAPKAISSEMAKLMVENAELKTSVEAIQAMAEMKVEFIQERANDKTEMMEAYAELQAAYLSQMAESQMEVARLQAGLEMTEGLQEIWGEMMELQAENAQLITRLELTDTREVKKSDCESCVDTDTVQNFHKFAQEMQKQLASKEAENESLRKRIEEMEAQVKALAERQQATEIR